MTDMKHLMTLLLLAGLMGTTSALYKDSPGLLNVQFSINAQSLYNLVKLSTLNQEVTLNTFISDLANVTSTVFQAVSSFMNMQGNTSFFIISGYTGLNISSLSNGLFTVKFTNQASVPDINIVQNIIKDNIFSNFIVPDTLVVTNPNLPSTTSTNPPASEGSATLKFSLNQTFTPDLSNTSSPAFLSLAFTVVSDVNRVFSKTPGFLRSLVNSFISGSVITNMTLVFTNRSVVPSASSIVLLFNSSTSLSIVPGTITANSGSALHATAFSLAVLPVTLALLLGQLMAS